MSKRAEERARTFYSSENFDTLTLLELGRKCFLEGYEQAEKDLAASPRQEQPEGLHFTPLNRLIQKIPYKNWNDTVNNYAKKLCDCLIKEGYRKDAEVLQGYISYMNGNNVPMATMDEQERPEVDLDKLVNEEFASRSQITEYGPKVIYNRAELSRFIKRMALVFNARKEGQL